MDGKKRPPQSKDFKDPFNAGQMVGMLTTLMYIEQNGGISKAGLEELKYMTAANAQIFFEKPMEDVLLMVEEMVKEIKEI